MLALSVEFLLESANDYIQKAVRLLQIGQYQYALDDVERAVASGGAESPDDGIRIDLLTHHLRSALNASPDTGTQLRWRVDPCCWESDWIRDLLSGTFDSELDGRSRPIPSDGGKFVIVDNLLTRNAEELYRSAFTSGARVCLIHLSDEGFKDDVSSYRWCSLVYRNYWSPLLSYVDGVKAFPLGVKKGFKVGTTVPPASERKWIWGFAGDIKKSTRAKMVDAMRTLGESRLHLTSGFASADALDVDQYQSLLTSVVFSPCPSGFLNLDCSRVYESLECGAIPIVEKRGSFDYFRALLGAHPMPTIDDWVEAPLLIKHLIQQHKMNDLQQQCTSWWRLYKNQLGYQMRRDILHMV